MEKWAEIRRLVLVEGRSKRSVRRQFGIHGGTLNKILGHSEPPGYRLGKPRTKRKIGPYLESIDQILQQDKDVHRKQRHTTRRIFERLREEYGYPGGYTAVKEVVRERERQGREVFLPLIHPPGEAQVDFGFADVLHDGHRPVTVVAGIDEVRLVVDNHLVAQHRRHWGQEHTEYDPVHYLALLERKPGALDFARPLDGWNLPGCFDLLRRRLEAQLDHKGTREYIKVLRLLEKASIHELAEAVGQALAIGAISYDAVRVILQNRQERPVGLFCLDGRPHLKLVQVEPPNLGAYRALVAGGAS